MRTLCEKYWKTWLVSTPYFHRKEVALILLKGLSFKEMVELRNTKEKTVRQQASAIYHKSKVYGRHEFAAWFFEDKLIY